jgi:hypothetical protein
VFSKKVIFGGLAALILVIGSCLVDEKVPAIPEVINPEDTSTAQSFGTFRVKLIPENNEDPENPDAAYTSIVGVMCDGPTLPEFIFEEKMKSGPCRLLKAISPYCADCGGLGSKCVAENSCMTEPNKISVGKLTINGFKSSGAKMSFTIEPSNRFAYQMSGVQLDYPPSGEGDTITFSAEGSASAAAFSLKVRGITPLVVLSDTIILEDTKPITLKWEPPKVAGFSTIFVKIDISYHGGTKGQIQAECEDNGSLTIPGPMLDQLKSYGMAGWPTVDITRRSVGVDEISKAQAVIECTVVKLLTIPGLTSCNGNDVCPDGQTCIDRKCQ